MGVILSVGEASGCGAVGGKRVKNCQYEKILDAMPDTGVYVIRAKDRSVLYFNRRAGAAARVRVDIVLPVHPVTLSHFWGYYGR